MNLQGTFLLLAIVAETMSAVGAEPQQDGNTATVTVHVLGPVTRPGKLAAKPDWSVNEVIKAAGGAGDGIRLRKCRIIRGTNEIEIKKDDFEKARPGQWSKFKSDDIVMFSYSRFSTE